MAWLDLDELDKCPPLACGATGLRRIVPMMRIIAGFALKENVLNRLESLTGERPEGRVMLLTQLRFFSFHLIPSIFTAMTRQRRCAGCWPKCAIRLERTTLLRRQWSARPAHGKPFTFLPFNPMDMIYHWRFNNPDNTLHMH